MATQNGWNNKISTGSAITLNCGTNSLNISSDASAGAVNLATGAAPKVVTLGSTNAASSLDLQYGTADFSLASATGNVMVALDSGEVTEPLQPAFSAYLPSADLNQTGTGTVYDLGTVTALREIFDQNADFNVNGTFTAPVTGKYQLNTTALATGPTTGSAIVHEIKTSNRTYAYAFYRAAGSSNLTGTNSVLADMDAGDTAFVRIITYGDSADTVDIAGTANSVTSFSGCLVC